MPEAKEKWHASKNIPIINLLGLLISTLTLLVSGTWAVSELTNTIEQNSRDTQVNTQTIHQHKLENDARQAGIRDFTVQEVGKVRAEIRALERETSAQAVAIGRIEVGVESVKEVVETINKKLNGGNN